jgi:hypothetical protein
MDGDVPQPDARHAFAGEANPADALPAFEDGIVTDADRSELSILAREMFTRCLPSWLFQGTTNLRFSW